MSLVGIGTLLGGLGGLAGAFGGGKSSYNERLNRDKFNAYQEIVRQDQRDHGLQYFRAAAERAGFNPLAVLNSGGSPGQYQPAFASGYSTSGDKNGLANGLAAIGATLTDLEALKIRKAELELDKQRLEKLNQDVTLKAPQGGIYQRGANETSGRSVTGRVRGNTTDNPLDVGIGGFGKRTVNQDPNTSDIENYEQRYGDIVGAVLGIPLLGIDAGRTVYDEVAPWFREKTKSARKSRLDRNEAYHKKNYKKLRKQAEEFEKAKELQEQNPYYRH